MSSNAFFGTVFDDQTRVSINVFSESKSQLSGWLLEEIFKIRKYVNFTEATPKYPNKKLI
jgi:hypothetical protein